MAINKEAFIAYLESDGEIDFDMYAQDNAEWEPLTRHVPGLIISSAGGLYPFQAEGLIHGLPFYFREEDDWATLKVGEADEDAYLRHLYAASASSEGVPHESMFPIMLLRLIPELKPAPFFWEFEGKDILSENGNYLMDENGAFITSDTKKTKRGGWGFTPEEGYAATLRISEYMEEKGYSAAWQRKVWLAQQFDPTPVNSDNRKWPDPVPVFEVIYQP